ncbi:GTPase activating protein 1-like [Phragmites australis]|uniref:GTPase activating protein 1-like n=1 Tax=Phragmites australis TaxID=29695 RepID=UPI002D7A3329|nr:GTPase activating protein 1-like [Phragmites australis]
MPPLPGFLTVRVLRGVNLVSRDATGSDPYVVLNLDNQKVKTSVIKKTVNPVWNEDLTLAVRNAATPIKLEVFDKDTFSKDDRMGDAEFDIEALMQIIQMDLEDIRSGTVVRTVRPSKQCCLADESRIIWENGQLVQDILLKLRNVETGVVHLQLKWVNIPGTLLFLALLGFRLMAFQHRNSVLVLKNNSGGANDSASSDQDILL